MYKIDHATAVPTPPVRQPAATQGFFTDTPTPPSEATVVTDDWANIIQNEISYCVSQAGLTNNKLDDTQLYQSMLNIIGAQTSPYKKNFIINGNMEIWQRGTVHSGITTTKYTADRWFLQVVTHGTWTVQKITDGPAGDLNFPNCLEAKVTTADTTVNTLDVVELCQHVEGYNTAHIFQKKMAITFWVKSNLAGQYYFAIDNTADRSYVIPYTISSANTWEKKTIYVTSTPSGGTWNLSNDVGMTCRWVLALGSTYHTTTFNQWFNNGEDDSGSNQVNLAATVNNFFRITGVQIEAGDKATDYEYRPFSEELQLCQRYYEKSYDVGEAPGTAGTATAPFGNLYICNRHNATGNYEGADPKTITFQVMKRAAFVVAAYSPVTGAIGNVAYYEASPSLVGAYKGDTTQIVIGGGPKYLYLQPVGGMTKPGVGGIWPVGDFFLFHWTADAEL